MKVRFIGHNTFLMTLEDGRVLITDPWFKNSRIWRAVAPAVGPDKIARLDIMLSSHNHLDHIDDPSLQLAKDRGAEVIGSKRVARRAEKWGVKATALRPGDEVERDGLVIRATPADHPLASDAIGFLLEWRGRRIYFSGDTRRTAELAAFLKRFGPIDLAFLQTQRAVYIGIPDGMDASDAAALARELGFLRAVPMHLHARFKKPNPKSFEELIAGHKQAQATAVTTFNPGDEKSFFEE